VRAFRRSLQLQGFAYPMCGTRVALAPMGLCDMEQLESAHHSVTLRPERRHNLEHVATPGSRRMKDAGEG